jgi:DNA-binding MarR family transcriptional regulator
VPATVGVRASARSTRGTPRQGSKLAEVMSLLGRKKGAGIEELIAATGWLPHTTRAALTGLRKRGFAIERWRNEQGTVYRIVAGTASALAA